MKENKTICKSGKKLHNFIIVDALSALVVLLYAILPIAPPDSFCYSLLTIAIISIIVVTIVMVIVFKTNGTIEFVPEYFKNKWFYIVDAAIFASGGIIRLCIGAEPVDAIIWLVFSVALLACCISFKTEK